MALPKSKSLSISQLMAKVKANITRYRAEQTRQTSTAGSQVTIKTSRSTIIKSMEASKTLDTEYTTRVLNQEIDTVAICPAHNEYMIIGTYSLVQNGEPTNYAGQARRGSLQVMTVNPAFKPKYAGMLPPQLDRVDFPCAVLDIHFHPSDWTLLGVATSNAHIYFYRFIVQGDVLGRRVITKLLLLGNVRVAQNDEYGLTPLVTQFTWLSELRTHGVKGVDDVIDVGFAAVTSFGEVKVVKLSIPAVKDMFDERVESNLEPLVNVNEVVHKHDLEAWTIAAINAHNSQDASSDDHKVILSGGDDSALVASTIKSASPSNSPSADPFDTRTLNANVLWRDRRSHTAGVVAILPLSPLHLPTGARADQTRGLVPILTGSYDEYLRLFELDTTTNRATLKTELRLNGGVWRLKCLDEYSTGESEGKYQLQTLILASLMHAGAAILRITWTASDVKTWTWEITPVTTFQGGHESMVYCCDARLEACADEPDNGEKAVVASQDGRGGDKALPAKWTPSIYTIVSTSFYDMKICRWRFVDEYKIQNQ